MTFDYPHQHLPASRKSEAKEIQALYVDGSKPTRPRRSQTVTSELLDPLVSTAAERVAHVGQFARVAVTLT